MNTRPVIESPSEHAALSVTFNNDSSRFVVGLDSGFCIFVSHSGQIQTARDFNAGLGLVQMMGNANYLALVGGGRSPKFPQNKVIVWDDSKNKTALEIATLTSVRGVQITKSRIAVVLQNSVRVYAFKKPPQSLARYDTADNPYGLCCLTDKYLVFPGRTPGHLQVVHLDTDSVSIIPAHTNSLRALSLDEEGKQIATASERGTMIRVWNTSTCAKLAERRRGTETATIYSLRFSPSGNLLACTSDKGSLHIFEVPNVNSTKNKWQWLGSIPFGPFSDVYSFTSTQFETGDEPLLPSNPRQIGDSPGLGTSKPIKGVIGWIDEESLIVVGAGVDARWEKFILMAAEENQTIIKRVGWKRYLGN